MRTRFLGWKLSATALALALVLAACSTGEGPEEDLVRDLAAQGAAGRYLVVLKERPLPEQARAARERAVQVAREFGLEPNRAYGAALVGFAAVIPAERLAAVRNHPQVAYVEAERVFRAVAQQTPTGVRRIFADPVKLDIDGSDDLRVDVDVAILDTGIDFEHPDLYVVGGADCTQNSRFDLMNGRVSCVAGGDDDHYHGTHVAGTVGALDNGEGVVGVAPGARLWAVKVLDSGGSGYTSEIIAGIDWVTERYKDIEVINMSLGGSGTSQATNDAIARAVNAGVIVVVAAGNSDADAANYTPANSPEAFTVSALADFNGLAGGGGAATCRSDVDDTFADFSNWGSVVDLIAPGVCITSTYPLEQGAYATISGTSMASPHAAGAAALLASGSSKPSGKSGVDAIRSTLRSKGNFNWDNRDDGDTLKEPLLDISTFSAAMVSSGGGGEPEPQPGDIALSASGSKVKGVKTVNLSWSGASGTSVDIFRDGSRIATTANDGAHTDSIGGKGGGSYTYKVCEAGTSTCSNEATVTF